MTRTRTPRPLTERQIKAAALVAQGHLSKAKICAKIGISLRCLTKWRARKDFQEEVDRQIAVVQQAESESLIATKKYRMAKLEDLARRLEKIMREQAAAPDMKDVPGGSTGFKLIEVESYKVMVPVKVPVIDKEGNQIGEKETGKFRSDVKFIRMHKFDEALFKPHQSLYEQIATETGEWKKVVQMEHSGQISVDVFRQMMQDAEPEQEEESEADGIGAAQPE